MSEFLLEVLSEEIPARMQARAASDLARLVGSALEEGGLGHESLDAFVTPRRLVLTVQGLPVRQPDRREERKGPRTDAPQKAVDGFLRSAGLTLDQCERRQTPKGEVWFAVIDHPGRPTPEVLAEIVSDALKQLNWPKSMRWAEADFRWVRPLHQILAVFAGRALPGAFEPDARLKYVFTNQTVGHRFMAPQSLPVEGIDDYFDRLRAAKVIVKPAERRAEIERQLAEIAEIEALEVRPDPGLLDEVAGLVEWPRALAGRIDDAYLSLPAEVLTTSMRTHQRYFALQRPDGTLAPRFVMVANIDSQDGGGSVIDGNERVLRARLSDARFFWDQDRRTPLEARVPRLSAVIFHARLGTMADKVERMARLAGDLAVSIGADAEHSRRAARLAKADLVSGMVAEFPELQGIMGGYYAKEQGEAGDVAQAITDHYTPQGPNDSCPTRPVSAAVALADKVDTLVGFFGIEEMPTGSRDPYALRRNALGVIRIIVENEFRLSLRTLFGLARSQYGQILAEAKGTEETLVAFFADRLKVVLRDQGVRHDLIDAVFAAGTEDDLVRLLSRVRALEIFLASDDGANLLVAYRRAANIVRIEARRDGVVEHAAVNPDLLAETAEKRLNEALVAASEQVNPLMGADRFGEAMEALAGLRDPVDVFFDAVTVNVEDADLRRNRLALLHAIVATMDRLAAFSRIEG